MAVRPGLNSQALYQVPIAVSSEAQSQQAHPKTLYGRQQMGISHITLSTEAQAGTPSLFQVSRVGVGLTLHTILTRGPSLQTVCCRIRSICIMPVKAYLKPRMAEARGQKFLTDRS